MQFDRSISREDTTPQSFEEETTAAKYDSMSASATQGGHKKSHS